MLIDRFRYEETLKSLWHRVFGDSYSYIELIFNKRFGECVLCFAEIENDEAVSAFYLLKSRLHYGGEDFEGYYLYAAATDVKHRGKSIMSKLIREAQLYCEKTGYDFISLVPSEKSLYDYYGRFAFVSAMYCVTADVDVSADESVITAENYYARRNRLCKNHIIFDEQAFMYAAYCLKKTGYDFYLNGDSISIKNSDGEILEVLSNGYSESGLSEKYPFGMLYPINSELKRDWNYTDIYMNIALD